MIRRLKQEVFIMLGLYVERCLCKTLKVLDQLPAKQRCMVVLDPAGVASGSREMKEKKKEAEKEGLKVGCWNRFTA